MCFDFPRGFTYVRIFVVFADQKPFVEVDSRKMCRSGSCVMAKYGHLQIHCTCEECQNPISANVSLGEYLRKYMQYTMEPSNEGHFRAVVSVLCKEVVFFSRLKMHWNNRKGPHAVCPLCRGCLYLEVSTIRGSTAHTYVCVWRAVTPSCPSWGVPHSMTFNRLHFANFVI